MQFLLSLIGRPKTDKPAKQPKPTKLEKQKSKELAEAEMNLAHCESQEEYYRHMTAFYEERIMRLKHGYVVHHIGGSE